MEIYAGIDLHSSNNYIGIINEQDQRLYGKRIPNELNRVLSVLEPFKKELSGVVVESTYNWYWLVDGLKDNGYKLHLANPSAIKQYEGLKHTDDKWDSFWLAHMLRLGTKDIADQLFISPKTVENHRSNIMKKLDLHSTMELVRYAAKLGIIDVDLWKN